MELTSSLVALGVLNGLLYATLAVGVVLVQRVSGVVHLGQPAVGVVAAAALAVAVERWDVPWWVAVGPALAVAAVAAVALHAAVDLRLAGTPPVIRLIATLGGGQAMLLAGIALLDQAGTGRRVPGPPGVPALELPALRIDPAQLLGLVVLPVTVALVALFLVRSRSGLAARALAADGELALNAGIDTAATARLIWALAGVLSGLAALVALPTSQVGVTSGLSMLARVLVVVVVARSGHLATVLVVGLLLGVVEQVVLDVSARSDAPSWLLWALTLLALGMARRRGTPPMTGRGPSPWGRLPTPRRAQLMVRPAPVATLAVAIALAAAAALPAPAALGIALAAAYAVMALGAGVEAGLVGGLPLGAAGVAGAAGAASAATVGATGVFLAGPVAAVVTGALCALLAWWPGRRRDLLAAATASLTAGLVLERTVVPRLVGEGQAPGRPVIAGVAVEGSRPYAIGAVALAVAVSVALWWVWRSALGRRLVLLRDDPQVARSLGVRAGRVRCAGVALGGAVTGLGGALYAHALPLFSPSSLPLDVGVLILAMLAVGGVTSPVGGACGALLIAGLPLLLGGDVGDVMSVALGWLLLLLYLPGGLASLVGPRPKAPVLRWEPDQDEGVPSQRVPSAGCEDCVTHTPLLTASRVSLSHGGVPVLDEVSVALHPGEVVALVGANGAGKSSLLDVLSGLSQPDSGRIDTARGLRPEHLVRCFQDGLLPSTCTGADLVAVALGGRGERRRAEALMERAGLAHLAGVEVRAMSHGQRRRVELTAATARRPRVLLLDEPTAGVARDDVRHVLELVRRARQDGAAVLVATHDDLLAGVCDRVVCLRGGRLHKQPCPRSRR